MLKKKPRGLRFRHPPFANLLSSSPRTRSSEVIPLPQTSLTPFSSNLCIGLFTQQSIEGPDAGWPLGEHCPVLHEVCFCFNEKHSVEKGSLLRLLYGVEDEAACSWDSSCRRVQAGIGLGRTLERSGMKVLIPLAAGGSIDEDSPVRREGKSPGMKAGTSVSGMICAPQDET